MPTSLLKRFRLSKKQKSEAYTSLFCFLLRYHFFYPPQFTLFLNCTLTASVQVATSLLEITPFVTPCSMNGTKLWVSVSTRFSELKPKAVQTSAKFILQSSIIVCIFVCEMPKKVSNTFSIGACPRCKSRLPSPHAVSNKSSKSASVLTVPSNGAPPPVPVAVNPVIISPVAVVEMPQVGSFSSVEQESAKAIAVAKMKVSRIMLLIFNIMVF
jgi:hypothetical protein